MDARTRERLPVLPVLTRSAARHRRDAEALLPAARQARPGAIITAGHTLTRSATTTAASIWADDPRTGKRRNLTAGEGDAFWAWAIVEVLRATGIRVEEPAQLSHHSLVQYRLPGTGELVPLLQITPSKTDAERLLVVSPELADVLSAIITRVRDGSRQYPWSPSTTTTSASGCRPPRSCSSGRSAPRTAPSPRTPSARSCPAP
jgi:hypothetical protein